MDKEDVVHIQMEYCSALKQNEIMSLPVTCIDLKISILSEVSQKEKDKFHMILFIYGI